MCDFQCDLLYLFGILWIVTQFWNISHHWPPMPNPTYRKFLCLTKYFCMLCLATHLDTGQKSNWSKRNQFKSAGGPVFVFSPISGFRIRCNDFVSCEVHACLAQAAAVHEAFCDVGIVFNRTFSLILNCDRFQRNAKKMNPSVDQQHLPPGEEVLAPTLCTFTIL